MLHRRDESGLTLISQPAHAWISGQLAACWGNNELELARPIPELILATEQHDLAWLDWESRPTLNPKSGLPYAFNELPTADHLGIWKHASPRALSYGRVPALLISMHGTYLYRRFHDFDSDSSEEVVLARSFLEREESFQADIMASLMDSSDISAFQIKQMRELLSLWDAVSLALSMGFYESRTFDGVPTNNGSISMRLTPRGNSDCEFSVDPWPFQIQRVDLQCEGRRLNRTFSDEQLMRTALSTAQPRTLQFSLFPIALES